MLIQSFLKCIFIYIYLFKITVLGIALIQTIIFSTKDHIQYKEGKTGMKDKEYIKRKY